MSLKDNPFYILNLSCKAGRREIASAAEEMSFIYDSDVCSKSQNELINPVKRLGAEIDWFIDADDAQMQAIRSSIDALTAISTEGLSCLSRLNAALFNFSLIEGNDPFDLGFAILDIDEQFCELDTEEITEIINNQREFAKIGLVQEQDVASEINNKRNSIKSIISDKLAKLDEDSYIDLITKLAERLVEKEDSSEGIILSDAIDQYEVRIQSTLEELTEGVRNDIEKIKRINDGSESKAISVLIWRVKTWDKYAQPLQLKSQASGMPHEISEDLGRDLRQLAIFLHNEKGKTQEALTLVDAMQGVFAELGGLSDLFESDSSTLNELIQGEKETQLVKQEFDAVKNESEKLCEYADEARVNNFINHIKKLDDLLKSIDWNDDEEGSKLRELLCMIARGTAVQLHNTKHQTAYALRIAEMLTKEFGDLISVRTKIIADEFTLRQQLLLAEEAASRSPRANLNNSSTSTTKSNIYNSGTASPTGTRTSTSSGSSKSQSGPFSKLVWFLIIFFGITLFGRLVASCNSSSPSSTTKTNTSTSSVSTSFKVTFDKQSGSGGTSYVYADKDKAMPSATAPSRSGYDFKGYFDYSGGKGTMYYDSNMRSAHSWDKSGEGKLYAYWIKKQEKKYSSSASAGDLVYVDIVSIFPGTGIYMEGSNTYHHFVCECKTNTGSTVWVYISVSDYQSKFDSSASSNIFSLYADEKEFSSSKRIHGEMIRADGVVSGLSSKTGTYIIEYSSVG